MKRYFKILGGCSEWATSRVLYHSGQPRPAIRFISESNKKAISTNVQKSKTEKVSPNHQIWQEILWVNTKNKKLYTNSFLKKYKLPKVNLDLDGGSLFSRRLEERERIFYKKCFAYLFTFVIKVRSRLF